MAVNTPTYTPPNNPAVGGSGGGPLIGIRPNERVTTVGMTGSGKTYFNRAMLAGAGRLVVIDSKGLIAEEAEAWRLTRYPRGWRALRRGKPGRVLFPPPTNKAEYESIFDMLMGLRDCIIYIDELFAVGPAQGSDGLRALYTRGREFGLGVWGCSQRPRWIPLFVLSEAEYKVVFKLEMLQDREYMADIIGPAALVPLSADEHQFILYNGHTGRSLLVEQGIAVGGR